ncbi:MAG: hypothetical protein OH333_04935 [Candidatus Parvarchaeota archaeon]|nr:hypothetical protein [Candidatus Jingweiarchaeum tengchongense]MCW1311093.1 hypothetical protein [Candidatus Jingweiarchaeum tengchongense]
MEASEKKEEKIETKEEKKRFVIKFNPWKALAIFFGILFVASLATNGFSGFKSGPTGLAIGTSTLSAEQAANKAIDWLNSYFKAAGQNIDIKLLNTSEVSGMYAFTVEFSSSQGNATFTYYVTKDGELFLPQAIPTSELIQAQPGTQEAGATCESLPKESTPKLEAFVVSYCPYGIQMQRVLAEIIKNIPELANYIKVRYLGAVVNGKVTAMHGDQEATENLRQICIREEQPNKFWDYISCFIKKGDSAGCLDSTGIDKTKLETCMSDSNKGIKYAQEDFSLQDNYRVTGSPTLILNGQRVSEFNFGGRSAQAVKTLLCCGFTDMPSVCEQNLTTTQAATSFSEAYSSSSSGSGGQC